MPNRRNARRNVISEVVPKLIDAAGLAFELLHGRNVGQRDDVVDE